uniref:MBD domain-containing protein n=1 Tax=Kalanchoe fedtschenkoi TaxID=63787 RepID=A0A7N0SZE3_KALFE
MGAAVRSSSSSPNTLNDLQTYYCPNSGQQFGSLDDLLRYVRYAKARQPELFNLWSGAEVYLPPQKTRRCVPKRKTENITFASPTDSKDMRSGKPIIVYQRRSKLAALKSNRSRIRACNLIRKKQVSSEDESESESEEEVVPNAVSKSDRALKVAAARWSFDSAGRLMAPKS